MGPPTSLTRPCGRDVIVMSFIVLFRREAEHRRESREGHNGESGREHQDSAANQRLAGTDS